MADALIIKAPGTLSAPGSAPRIIPTLPVAGAVRRYVAASLTQDDSSTVASWPDFLGGAALTQSTPAACPTFDVDDGGTPSVILDGTDDFMTAEYTGATSAHTVILWARMRSLPASSAYFFYASLRQTSSPFSLSLFSTTGVLTAFGTNPVGSTGTTVTVDTTNYHMVAFIIKGAGSTVIKDTTVYSGADSGALHSPNTVRLGKNSTGGVSPLSVKELIVYPSALTTGEVETTRAFLADLYA